jgi:nitroreductase
MDSCANTGVAIVASAIKEHRIFIMALVHDEHITIWPEVFMFNDTRSTLALLHSRRSGKARDMIAPGPDAQQLDSILQAAARVPDHGKLAPWRFVIVASARRAEFADVIEQAYRTEKPQASDTEIKAMRAYGVDAPTLVAVLSTPKQGSAIPLWEQELSAGAAIQNMLVAAHSLGFVGNWLTGWPAYSAAVRAALGGGATDKIAGFIYFGTAAKPLDERPRPNMSDIISYF